MLARLGISWGARAWEGPWRARKATGVWVAGVEVDEVVDLGVWWRMWIGEDGGPHGVEGVRVAACVRFGRAWRPVPPIIAMWTGSIE